MKQIVSITLCMAMMVSVGAVSAADVEQDVENYGIVYDAATGIEKRVVIPKMAQNYSIKPYVNPMNPPTPEPYGFDSTWAPVSALSSAPYSGIVKLVCHYSNEDDAKGTGFIVGDGRIATAAHNIYKDLKKKWMTSIDITFQATGRTVNVTTGIVADGWTTSTTGNANMSLDYGALAVDPSYTQGLHKFQFHPYVYTNFEYAIAGFPTLNGFGSNVMYSDKGTVSDSNWYGYGAARHNININSGVSGAPMYATNNNYVAAIQTRGWDGLNTDVGGYATLITPTAVNLLLYRAMG